MKSDEIFSQLGQMSQLKIQASCRGMPPSFPKQVGEGSVTQTESEGGLVFCERGIWKDSHKFTNLLRWSHDGEQISLEHLRFGSDKPVFLFNLSQVGEGLYKSVAPHACGEDHYSGILQVDGKTLTLIWRITGPKKNQEIIQTYS